MSLLELLPAELRIKVYDALISPVESLATDYTDFKGLYLSCKQAKTELDYELSRAVGRVTADPDRRTYSHRVTDDKTIELEPMVLPMVVIPTVPHSGLRQLPFEVTASGPDSFGDPFPVIESLTWTGHPVMSTRCEVLYFRFSDEEFSYDHTLFDIWMEGVVIPGLQAHNVKADRIVVERVRGSEFNVPAHWHRGWEYVCRPGRGGRGLVGVFTKIQKEVSVVSPAKAKRGLAASIWTN